MPDKSQQMGIALTKTSKHTPESNCVAEKIDRPLMEKAKQMLEKAGESHFFGVKLFIMPFTIQRNYFTSDRQPYLLWEDLQVVSAKRDFENIRMYCLCSQPQV